MDTRRTVIGRRRTRAGRGGIVIVTAPLVMGSVLGQAGDTRVDRDGEPIPVAPCIDEPPFDDFGCLQPGKPCEDVDRFVVGLAVARLNVHFRNAAGSLEVVSCTGFLIKESDRRDLLITARHCLENDDDDDIPAGFEFTHLTAEFFAHYPGNCADPTCESPDVKCFGNPVISGHCVYRDEDCDWALVKLHRDGPLAVSLGDPSQPLGVGDQVFIPQHPQGRCKEIAEGVVHEVPPDGCSFRHRVDTQEGSSGSPVFPASFGANFQRVVGVHVAGGCDPADPASSNVAIKLGEVTDGLPAAIAAVEACPDTPIKVVCTSSAGDADCCVFSWRAYNLSNEPITEFYLDLEAGTGAAVCNSVGDITCAGFTPELCYPWNGVTGSNRAVVRFTGGQIPANMSVTGTLSIDVNGQDAFSPVPPPGWEGFTIPGIGIHCHATTNQPPAGTDCVGGGFGPHLTTQTDLWTPEDPGNDWIWFSPLCEIETSGNLCQLPDERVQGHGTSMGLPHDLAEPLPGTGAVAALSDFSPAVGFISADDFTPSNNRLINEVCWWGGYFDVDVRLGCSLVEDTFRVTYYEDAGLAIPCPGAVLAVFGSDGDGPLFVKRQRTLRKLETDMQAVEQYEYTAVHAPLGVLAGTRYWLEISNESGTDTQDTCVWFWQTAPGNLLSVQSGPTLPLPPVTYNCVAPPPNDLRDYDLAWCIGLGPCRWDLNGDGLVGPADLLIALAAWGAGPGHAADFNGDGVVGAADLLQILAFWGPCP